MASGDLPQTDLRCLGTVVLHYFKLTTGRQHIDPYRKDCAKLFKSGCFKNSLSFEIYSN